MSGLITRAMQADFGFEALWRMEYAKHYIWML